MWGQGHPHERGLGKGLGVGGMRAMDSQIVGWGWGHSSRSKASPGGAGWSPKCPQGHRQVGAPGLLWQPSQTLHQVTVGSLGQAQGRVP